MDIVNGVPLWWNNNKFVRPLLFNLYLTFIYEKNSIKSNNLFFILAFLFLDIKLDQLIKSVSQHPKNEQFFGGLK